MSQPERPEFAAPDRPAATLGELTTPWFIAVSAAICVWTLFTPPVLEQADNGLVSAVLVGAVFGQIGLLSTWSVVGTQPDLIRWPATFLVLVMLGVCWILGVMIATPIPIVQFHESASLLLASPLVYASLQVPLWVMRWFGWHLCHPSRGIENARAARVHIWHLCTGIGVVGTSLGLARFGFAMDSDPVESWFNLARWCMAGSLWSLILCVPCLFVGFLSRTSLRAVVFVTLYLALVSGLGLAALWTSGGPLRPRSVATAIIFVGATAGFLLSALLILRSYGYTLDRHARRFLDVAVDSVPHAADSSRGG